MDLQTLMSLRLVLGTWGAVAAAYGVNWPLSFMAPLFTAIFLVLPVWIGWKFALQLSLRLGGCLLLGVCIAEFLLGFPVICVLVYTLLFFLIYYNDTPLAPPMATLFMTIGITIVPMMGLAGAGVPQFIAMAVFVNMMGGIGFAWFAHKLLPNSKAAQLPTQPSKGPEVSLPAEQDRIQQAISSTIVASIAIVLFFSLNLLNFAFAMIQICLLVGSGNSQDSAHAMKENALACCIGGVAIIGVYYLLAAVPTYDFLLAIILLVLLLFSRPIFSGHSMAKAYVSGLTTFLVLLGTSTMADKVASVNFLLRISQIVFAGLFAVAGLLLIEHYLWGKRYAVPQKEPCAGPNK